MLPEKEHLARMERLARLVVEGAARLSDDSRRLHLVLERIGLRHRAARAALYPHAKAHAHPHPRPYPPTAKPRTEDPAV